MRRLIFIALVLSLAMTSGACKRKRKPQVKVDLTDESGTQQMLSTLSVADPRGTPQLVKGFFGLEDNQWRWTTSKFAVTLRPPAMAAQKGATLVFKFSIPDPVMAKVKSTTLSATVNGTATAPQTYTKAGEYVYSRDIPASALGGDSVMVEFSLDKFLPPSAADQRELAVIATSIGLEAK
jgi:hypothetical protein